MSAYGPDVQGGGVYAPLREYMASVTENFPRVTHTRTIESSIASRRKLDILPVNLGADNTITDNYIEYRIPGVAGHLLDMSSLILDLEIGILKEDGTQLTDDDHVIFTNGLSNTLFKSCSCYLNEQMVESNALFNYHSFIKMLTSISPEKIDFLGRSAFLYRDDMGTSGIVDTFTAESFAKANSVEKSIIKKCKNVISLTAPLFLDLTTLDAYLLDRTDVRIRLELANKSWLLNTHRDGTTYKIKIDSARMWVDRVIPHAAALQSLNKSLILKPMQYTYNRTLYKTYALGANQTSLVIELPYAQIIPQTMYMVIVDMESFSGNYTRNGLYFNHSDLSQVHISVNGSSVYNLHSQFPNKYSKIYYSCLEALGLETTHMLRYDAFSQGRSLFVFDFVDENVDNGIPVEKSGNLRINLAMAKAENKNRVILLFANTTGIIEIDSHRSVRCIVRA